MKTKVIELTREDIHWPFSAEPYVNVGQGRWGGQLHRVDPFPAYGHDRALTEETLARVAEAFPHGGELAIFLLPVEDLSRTNGWTQHDFEREYGEHGDQLAVQFMPSIGLNAKRTPAHPGMTRYLVAHEYGHTLASWFAFQRDIKNYDTAVIEAEYAALRGLGAQKHYGGGNWHIDHGEVFANDFRILICGIEAEYWPHPGIDRPDSPELKKKLREWWEAQR